MLQCGPDSAWQYRDPDIPPPEVVDGRALHKRVCPSRWCVTRSDIVRFRRVVRRAVELGYVTPTGLDGFDPADNWVGPSVHTVCKQLVAPVTRERGSPSWALMLHPEGYRCDVFITHAWIEGIYELLDKTLHSWPSMCTGGAYCCVLSNPQNLDIATLVDSPTSSPFAHALRASDHMLVVPNMRCSVYTRIWCVYEAHLAYSWGKTILAATQPARGLRSQVAGVLALGPLATGVTTILFRLTGLHARPEMLMAVLCVLSVCAVVIVLCSRHRWLCAGNYVGAAACGIYVGAALRDDADLQVGELTQLVPKQATIVLLSLASVFFALREADRLWDAQAEPEAAMLRAGFTGRLQDAASSVSADKEKILGEIRTQSCERDVEHCISVLISCGMSTPALRRASSKGVDVSDAGSWSIAMVHAVAIIFVAHPASHIVLDSSCSGRWSWVPWLKCVEGLAFLVLFKMLGPDQRGFAAAVGLKAGAVPYFLVWVVWIGTCFALGRLHSRSNCVPDAVGCLLWAPVMLVSAWLGVDGCSSVPAVGPRYVRLFLAPGPTSDAAVPVADTDEESGSPPTAADDGRSSCTNSVHSENATPCDDDPDSESDSSPGHRC